MTLILSNDDIAQVLPISDSLDRLSITLSRARRRARAEPPAKRRLWPDTGRRPLHLFKTMDSVLPVFDVASIRLCSDVISWEPSPDGIRKEKHPKAPGGKWVGLILLFSTKTGEPLEMIPDGIIQHQRVACTNAIAARYMADEEAEVYGVIGAGWQAHAQILAMANVHNFGRDQDFQPNQSQPRKAR